MTCNSKESKQWFLLWDAGFVFVQHPDWQISDNLRWNTLGKTEQSSVQPKQTAFIWNPKSTCWYWIFRSSSSLSIVHYQPQGAGSKKSLGLNYTYSKNINLNLSQVLRSLWSHLSNSLLLMRSACWKPFWNQFYLKDQIWFKF